MTKLLIVIWLTAAILALSGAQAFALTIKLATLAPEGTPWHRIIQDIGAAWDDASNGEIEIRIYGGGVAGDEPDMIRKMRVGQIHAAVFTGSGLSKIVPEVQAVQMPMLLTSYGELDYVMERLAPALEELLENQGFTVLNWGDGGWVRFFAREPVMRPEDLKALRLFVWAGDPAYVDAWKEAGFRPVAVAATEIHTALQSGLIDAVPTIPIAALAFQWFGLANHMTDLHWAPLIGATVISTKMWNKIPEELRPRFREIAREVAARSRGEIRGLENEAINVMKKHGLIVHEVPPDLRDYWERSARTGYSTVVGRIVPADMVAEVKRLRNEYRARNSGQ